MMPSVLYAPPDIIKLPVCVTVLDAGVYVNVFVEYAKLKLRSTAPAPLIVNGTPTPGVPPPVPTTVIVLPTIGLSRNIVLPVIEENEIVHVRSKVIVFPLNVSVAPELVSVKFPRCVQLLLIVTATEPPGALKIANGTAQIHPADEYVTAATPVTFEVMPNVPVKVMLAVPSVIFPPITLSAMLKVMVPV
jgi:hypothetical protein